MAQLNLLNLTGMISDTNELAKKLAGQEYTEIESKIKSLPSESLRQYQAALIQKAIENDDLDKVLRKLKLLDEANLIPDYDKVRKQSAIKHTLPAGTRLRVVGIDAVGRDDATSARNPVLWARVDVLAD